MNLTEANMAAELHLDGLSFGPRELSEGLNLLQRYNATDKVYVLTLVDNGLEDDSVNLLLQLVFGLPYIRCLDLRKNYFTPDGIRHFEAKPEMNHVEADPFLQSSSGVTRPIAMQAPQ